MSSESFTPSNLVLLIRLFKFACEVFVHHLDIIV